jgi:AcrR family transcriptional regulator
MGAAMAKQKRGDTTKKRIFDTAIDMFSKRGYNGVSIRDLTKAVGIKESSLYNHFKSKDDIVLNIYNYFKEKILSREFSDEDIDRLLESMPAELYFQKVFDAYVEVMTSEEIVKIWKIIISEQFRDERARYLHNQEITIKLHTDSLRVLKRMQFKSLVKDIDLDTAVSILLKGLKGMMFDYLSLSSDGKGEEALEMMRKHIAFFWECIKA